LGILERVEQPLDLFEDLMIDITSEKLISIDDAAKLIPGRDGGTVHPLTMEKWTRSPGKRGVVLESVLAGPCRCTTVEALQRFIERVTTVASGQTNDQPAQAIATRSRRARNRAVRDAVAEMEAAGA
jgi:hypothetical protein